MSRLILRRAAFACALATAFTAQAAGPLIVSDETGTLKPVVWNMANGPIPVYADGGGAFSFDFDEVTPFVTLERGNELTAAAFEQWSNVPTATFAATIQGTIESMTGVSDVTGANAGDFIGAQNGRGFWVIYDTDGSIMEDYFGVSRNWVLGISSPEFGDGQGHITESFTVLNGYAVNALDQGDDWYDEPDSLFRGGFEADTRGERYAGVFTHEIGHAINLSHSQVNGVMAYQSTPSMPWYPGVPGCVAPLYSYTDQGSDPAQRIGADSIETMYPFIDSAGPGGEAQASVDLPDDVSGISNLYPTAQYLAQTGTISGVLRLKDGVTQYSGINVIARNVADPVGDAVSDMTGSAIQAMLGPDGRFTLRGLTPGQSYALYIEPIAEGGYPTEPQSMASQGEYWNTAESANPISDAACTLTPIAAVAGQVATADITYNGFDDGVQFTPLVAAYLSSLSTDGNRAGGTVGSGEQTLLWDRTAGITVLPDGVASYAGSIDGPGTHLAVQVDPDGNGIREPGIWAEGGSIQALGDLNGNSCGGDSNAGSDSAVAMGITDDASTVVGLAYVDRDGNGSCQGSNDEIVPMIRDAAGMRELVHDPNQPWTRANTVSGNGRVVLGNSNFEKAWAWVDEGPQIDLTALTGAYDANAVNHDGSVVALSGMDEDYRVTGILLWNALQGTSPAAFTNIDSLRYCTHIPYLDFFGSNLCEQYTPEEVYDMAGSVPIDVFGSNDAGTVLVGTAGSFMTGTYGAIWVQDLGWMLMSEFLHRQGVVEAQDLPIDNPTAISGVGDTIIGGLAGVQFSWLIDLREVYVCEAGQSVATTFPGGLRSKLQAGAEFGRCEFND